MLLIIKLIIAHQEIKEVYIIELFKNIGIAYY